MQSPPLSLGGGREDKSGARVAREWRESGDRFGTDLLQCDAGHHQRVAVPATR